MFIYTLSYDNKIECVVLLVLAHLSWILINYNIYYTTIFVISYYYNVSDDYHKQ